MWELRKLYVARFNRGPVIFIGERLDRAETYCPTGVEGHGVIEEWMCAVRYDGLMKPEIVPLAKCAGEDYGEMDGAVIEVAPSPRL